MWPRTSLPFPPHKYPFLKQTEIKHLKKPSATKQTLLQQSNVFLPFFLLTPLSTAFSSMRALHSFTSPSLHQNPPRSSLRHDHFSLPIVRVELVEPKWASIVVTKAQKNPNRPNIARKKGDKEGGKRKKKGEEEEPGHVRCEVHVISWRERAVHASIVANADVDSVWSVLTDYERLADFIPNLVYSGRIPCPHEGRIWLEQRGLQRALYWHIEARVVLDLQEIPNSANGRELHFSMVDGDFKKFEGKWSVKSGTRPGTAKLSYEVNVIPRLHFPAIFLERIIRSDLPINLEALAFWAERKREEITSINDTGLHLKVPVSGLNDISGLRKDSVPDLTTDGPLSGKKWGIYGNTCRIDKPCVVDEIHLRRFDGLLENGGTHRCVYACITVKAPVREVWNVLTAYEELPEIVPNLAISKVLLRDNNKVRILQEGCKGLLYMVLHARVILDLEEELEKEISFEQVEGDFDSFQGRWRLEQLGDHHTLLKYMVETKIHQDTLLSEAIVEEVIYEDLPSNLCAIRDYAEKVELDKTGSIEPAVVPISPDPDSLQFLQKSLSDQVSIFQPSKRANAQRPRVPGLQTDLEVLKSEILEFISVYGQDGFMPMRKQLRQHGRVDIEKAITKMGGFRKVAGLMNLSLAYKDRKPRGYWDSLDNLHLEIRRFQRNWGMDPMYMPSRKSFERAGRYDIARALEKWGGLQEVSNLLSLQLRRPRKQSSSDQEDEPPDLKLDNINGKENINGLRNLMT